MGWLFNSGCHTRQNIVDDLLGMYSTNDWRVMAHGSTAYGRRLWMCVQHPESNRGKSFILLCLLGVNDGYWGYKDVDESMGPYYYDCPAKVLKVADDATSKYAKEWREGVATYREQRKARRVRA